jgi:hypothetical protein
MLKVLMRLLSQWWALQRGICLLMHGREHLKRITRGSVERRCRWSFHLWLANMLEVEELLNILLRVSHLETSQHVLVKCKCRKLTRAKKIWGSSNGWRHVLWDRSRWFGSGPRWGILLTAYIVHDLVSSGDIARITGDKDVTAMFRTDRVALLLLNASEQSLLLAPFGAVLTLGAIVLSGHQLLNGNDRDRLSRGDNVIVLMILPTTSLLVMDGSDWRGIIL